MDGRETPRWRLLADPPRAGAANMAVDQALFESVQAGGPPVLRLYRWSPPCLSFGRNQAARGAFDPGAAADAGIDVVRRPTGGLAVLHHRELTYAVALPAALLGGPRATYHAVNDALVDGLRRIGVPATTGARPDAPAPLDRVSRDPCFARAAPGEVSAGGRKLVGSAQRCERRTILQHGSILLDGDQAAVTRLQRGQAPPAGAPITVRELLGRVPADAELEEALAAGFGARLGIRLERTPLSAGETRRAADLEPLYRSAEWTWRR